MSDSFIEWRKKENICPVVLDGKERYYFDLMNIEHSWTGRIDIGNIGNAFIMEAEQQIINAIELFEHGYFDCAYYLLRSAVDLSTTMVFLTDMPDDEKKAFLKNWKETKGFPMQGQMIKLLSNRGYIFSDMKSRMPDFFLKAKELSAELNKYVHKQGLQHFYISRNHPLNAQKSQETFIRTFEQYLHRCIGVVAVMRLAIDPFPILLMDEEILYRCFDTLTEAYSNDFVEKYIGFDIIDAYKRTDLYIGTYNAFIGDEKKNEAVFNVVKHQYIDSQKMDDLLKQLHLMSKDDIICVLLVQACNKVIKLYCLNGMLMYFTEKETNRKAMPWSGNDFKRFADATDKINQPYDEAYISVLFFEDTPYFIEHNEPLSNDEVGNMVGFVSGALNKIKNAKI